MVRNLLTVDLAPSLAQEKLVICLGIYAKTMVA
jgi:hypothetical protein